jgi:Leucine-rich repeat (LRR) protein
LNNNQLTTLSDGVFSGLTNLNYLYLQNNQLSDLSGDAFIGINPNISIYLENNTLHDLSDDVITNYGSKLQLNNNCFSSRDSSANTISLLQSKNSSWESNQYLCLKNVSYDPADPGNGTKIAGPVTATFNFYGPVSKENSLISSIPDANTYTFYDNGEYNVNTNNYPYSNYFPGGNRTLTAKVDRMEGAVTGGELQWTVKGRYHNMYVNTQTATSLQIDW